jgi:MYXO-CTERM domain-containing protein
MMRVWIGGLVLGAGLLGSGEVRADALMPPPEDCPPGTYGDSNHGGPYCAAWHCGGDAGACSNDATCEPRQLCIAERTGMTMIGTFTYLAVAGVCPSSGSCTEGTCQTLDVCVLAGVGTGGSPPGTGGSPPGTGGSPPGTGGSAPGTGGSATETPERGYQDSGCGCSVGAAPGTFAWTALAIFGLFAARRRRA